MRRCRNPACSRRARALGLCVACYQYWRRTGELRSEQVIVTSGYRRLVRELEARSGRSA